MDNEDSKNNVGNMNGFLPALKIESSAVSVTASTSSTEEQEIYYPETVPSGTIVADSTAAIGIQLSPEEREQMIEAVDYAKTHKPYISEFEISLNIREGFKFKIKRQPKKVIRYYSK